MKFAYPFLTAFFISLLLTPLVKSIAGRAGIVAKPKEDRWHKNVIPLMGGVAIYAAFIITYLAYLRDVKGGLGLLVGATSIFLLGVVDDLKGLSPQSKLVGQIVCASLTVISGFTINIVPSVLAIPLTILWIVGITNSFNLLDNMDGLSSGVAAIASLTVFACALALKNYEMAMFALILSGAALGFLPYNFYPAKIFMGDCGAMFLGFTLASIAVMGTWKEASHLFLVLLIPVLALAVPIFDTIFVTVTRTIDGRSVAKGGKDHTSHRMVFLGWHERKAVTVLYLISFLFGLAAYVSLYVKAYVSITIVTLLFMVVFSLGVFLNKMTRREEETAVLASPRNVAYYKNQSELIDALINYKRVIFEVVCDLCLICIAYFSSYIIRYDGIIDHWNFGLIAKSLPIMIVIDLLAFSVTGVYGNIWRYIGLNEILNIVKGVILGTVVSAAALLVAFRFEGFSRMIFLLDAMILLILMSAVRVAFRLFREQIFVSLDAKGKKILIFGAGDTGDAFLREVRKNKSFNYWPVGFVDDDPSKQGRRIQGVSVLGVRSDIPQLVEEHSIDEVIIAIPSADDKTKEDIEAICRESGTQYHQVSGIYLR